MFSELTIWIFAILTCVIALLIFIIYKIQLENNSTLVEIHNMVQEMKNKEK